MRFPASLLALALALPAAAQQQHIASTDPKSPADEQTALKVPAGFEVQLVAAEPDIQKPMQIAFDAKGRLWVCTSHAYPFPSAKPADKLFVLADIGPDGKAKKVTTFADDLNIPIGVLPLPDCNSVIVSEVGKIVKLTDTDGDGKADKREDLFTGFGTRDTHGMTNSFTHMPDGWVYACHGYLNDSRVKGKDGHEVHMQSGHTFRFRPDGSRIEIYTYGQVNPFGMAVDPWFNLYTADCHTKPITQLIRGAVYDSFGKPHDGLGYAPHVTRHDHNSTGLCGLAWYDADHFPKEYKGTMFLGNVITNRINLDKIEWKGSTPVAVEQPDFVVSSDPWFRPVDIKLGPDGALYFSDFYNRIIGHYEVDLKHPLRDKDRGRVWRVVWKGEPGASGNGVAAAKMPFADLTTEKAEKLIELLKSPNITTRLLATNELIMRGKDVLKDVETAWIDSKSPSQFSHLFWVMANQKFLWAAFERDAALNVLTGMMRLQKLTGEAVDFCITHGSRAIMVRPRDSQEAKKYDATWAKEADAIRKLPGVVGFGTEAHSLRAMLDAGMDRPIRGAGLIETLTSIVLNTPIEDTHLRHATRVYLRDVLEHPDIQDRLVWVLKDVIQQQGKGSKVLDDVFLGVPTAYAGWWLSERAKAGSLDPAVAERAFEHVGRYGCDVHRKAAADSLAAITDQRQLVARLTALARGVQAAGSAFIPDSIATQIRNGLDSPDEETVRRSLELAAAQHIPAIAATADNLARSPDRSEAVRLAALAVVLKAPPNIAQQTCHDLFRDPRTPPALKERTISVVAATGKLLDLIALKDNLKDAPYRLAIVIATGLAGKAEGADLLFAAVKAGQAAPRLLQEKVVLDRLRATRVRDLDSRIKELTAGLPSPERRLQQLILARTAGYPKSKTDVEAGKKAYATHCAACHQVGGQGGKVGPNLDGIGNRGLDRLLEDVIDPNRNVDIAFRATTLRLSDGRDLTGLLVREEGAVYILADAEGKEQRIPKADVEKKTITPLSPMPANVGEKVMEDEFYHLLAYLLELRVKDAPAK